MENKSAIVNRLKNEPDKFIQFLKNNYPVYHASNVFLRDIQHAVKSYFNYYDIKINLTEAETMAGEIIRRLEASATFIRIDDRSWRVNNPELTVKL